MAKILDKRFIVLIGGPGLFKGCDKEHDQTWTNYIVPLQLAAQRGLYQRMDQEQIYWVVYEPPYRDRWLDDSVITPMEKKQDDGYNLHSTRKESAENVKKRGAANYIARIRQIAVGHHFVYKGISKPGEFWDFIESCPKGSITRVWYAGHASPGGLMLALVHSNTCKPQAFQKDMILVDELKNSQKIKNLSDRFDKNSKVPSKFYGCHTNDIAKEWSQRFGVPSEGAYSKVNFGCIDQPSSIQHVLERIEQTPTSKGLPDWRKHK